MKALTRLYLTPATPETSDNHSKHTKNATTTTTQASMSKFTSTAHFWNWDHENSSNFQPSHAIPSLFKVKAVRAVVAGGTFGGASRIRDLRESGPLQAAWRQVPGLCWDQRFRWWPVQIFESKLGGLKQPNRLIDVDWVNCELDSFVFVWPKL